jgi:hypothetical protein
MVGPPSRARNRLGTARRRSQRARLNSELSLVRIDRAGSVIRPSQSCSAGRVRKPLPYRNSSLPKADFRGEVANGNSILPTGHLARNRRLPELAHLCHSACDSSAAQIGLKSHNLCDRRGIRTSAWHGVPGLHQQARLWPRSRCRLAAIHRKCGLVSLRHHSSRRGFSRD